MPKGTARIQGSSGEYINHFNMIRMRVTGSGNLKLTLNSLQDVRQFQLADISMSSSTDIQPFRLANFQTQRASITIGTTNINEHFRINRIIVYSRPIEAEYPA
jgi:hypothetical protein